MKSVRFTRRTHNLRRILLAKAKGWILRFSFPKRFIVQKGGDRANQCCKFDNRNRRPNAPIRRSVERTDSCYRGENLANTLVGTLDTAINEFDVEREYIFIDVL